MSSSSLSAGGSPGEPGDESATGGLWGDPAEYVDPTGDLILPSEAEQEQLRQRATARAGRAVKQKVSDLFGAGGPAFRLLANAHAASTAGDTLVAIALANSLFFQVPSAEARGNVALYLLLTMAPFAVIGPLLGRFFDRAGAERTVLIWASSVRVVAAVTLVVLADSIWLFPLAFSLLVLSRVHGIARSALLPQALSNPIALVTANARLAQVSVIGGGAAAPVGAALAVVGSEAVLVGAAAVFGIATWQSMVLPALQGRPTDATAEPAPPSPLPLRTQTPYTDRLRRTRRVEDEETEFVEAVEVDPRPVTGLLALSQTTQLRLAQFATAMVRLLNGFLVLILAFAFRDIDAPLFDFGAVLAAAGLGFGLAALAAPMLERALREEPMVVAALAVEAAAAFIAGQFFGLPAAAFLSLAAGYAWGTAKFAFDGLLQATVAAENRGRAFTRSETIFQLAWVLGAVIPTAIVLDVRVGLIIAGITALCAQTVYVSRLLQQR
ncbi:hypothetical protein [Euzebya tangerina]|uniref:hypothetical protein n=1 Tax=Euzebya tangerina TaxID=591198 RepID=UPI000E322B59|nr:hypothetical protein [Euzebya tangerina]